MKIIKINGAIGLAGRNLSFNKLIKLYNYSKNSKLCKRSKGKVASLNFLAVGLMGCGSSGSTQKYTPKNNPNLVEVADPIKNILEVTVHVPGWGEPRADGNRPDYGSKLSEPCSTWKKEKPQILTHSSVLLPNGVSMESFIIESDDAPRARLQTAIETAMKKAPQGSKLLGPGLKVAGEHTLQIEKKWVGGKIFGHHEYRACVYPYTVKVSYQEP